LLRLHRLFDIHNDFNGINSIKTVNNNAGVSPVKTDGDIIALLLYAANAYRITDGTVNVMLGPVIKKINEGFPHEELIMYSQYADIDGLIIDEEAGTVYLTHSEMSLDVGAVAKGYSLDRAAAVLLENDVTAFLINAGGDAIMYGKEWIVGIKNPFEPENDSVMSETIRINKGAFATSGDYYRGGHIIDPETLSPPARYCSVTVMHDSAAAADILSTAIFILPLEKGRELAYANNASVVWIFFDGTIEKNY